MPLQNQLWWTITTVTAIIQISENQNRKIACDHIVVPIPTTTTTHILIESIIQRCANIHIHVRKLSVIVFAIAGRLQCILDKEEIVQRYENNEQAVDIGYDYRVTRRIIERRLQS
jgi:hypothetical protein